MPQSRHTSLVQFQLLQVVLMYTGSLVPFPPLPPRPPCARTRDLHTHAHMHVACGRTMTPPHLGLMSNKLARVSAVVSDVCLLESVEHACDMERPTRLQLPTC